MKQALVSVAVAAGLFAPSFAFAYWNSNPSVNVVSVTLNGGTYGNGTYLQVNPGDPIRVTITADLTYKAKWKGTNWGINNSGATPICVNTKNKHAKLVYTGHGSPWYGGDDDDDNPGHNRFFNHDRDEHKFDSDRETNNRYSVTFTIYAPKTAGLYDANFKPDGKNNCGAPNGPLFVLDNAILVGKDTQAPVIAPHSDVSVTLADPQGTGTTVTYTNPTATDDIDASVSVSCSPASGTFFSLGSTVVSCFASDTAGNMAMPVSFNVTVALPPDVTPPSIAPHANISVQATDSNGAVVNYTTPTATDDRDGAVGVLCAPTSGSTFAVGTTTVNCTASDAAGNATQSSFDIGVYNGAPTPDTTAPTIASNSDIVIFLAHAVDTLATVTYTNPTATDDVDGAVAVSCTPASGSTFAVGSTTVTCTAQDMAGNTAQSTFVVGVYAFVPQPIVLASQTDESSLCATGWQDCFSGGSPVRLIDLGSGAGLQAGALSGVTLSLDPTYAAFIPTDPFRVSIICFTDAAYTSTCTDWVAGNVHNGNTNYFVFEDTLSTTDNQHWTANLTTADEQNFNGSSPVVFNPSYYYRLKIEEHFVGWPMYGSASGDPYWVINGLTQ